MRDVVAGTDPPEARIKVRKTHRLVASRDPPVDVFAEISEPADRAALTDLEGWTNDRIRNEYGERILVPRSEWATGTNASVVMAAFCHPHPTGGRFTSPELGAWYAAFEPRTAHAEVAFHRWSDFEEVGADSGRIVLREYLAAFDASFHDVRDRRPYATLYNPKSYKRSQALGVRLREGGSNGLVYGSVRDPGHDCIVAFRPKLVLNVRQGAHFEYVWSGSPDPVIRRLTA